MRKPFLRRIFSSLKLFFILLITIFLFGLVSLFIQLFVIKIRQTPQFISNKNLLLNFKETFKLKVNSNFISPFDSDYEKCKYLSEKQIELKDLRRMKASYLNELKSIETKRNKLKKVLEQLQNKVDSYMNDINDLRNRNFVLKQEIANNLIKQSQLDTSVIKQIELIETLKTNNKYSLKLNMAQNETLDICTLEKCFDFSKCKLNNKLRIFIFNSSSTNQIQMFLSKLNFEKINRSISLTVSHLDLKTSCLVVIFLINKSNKSYYKSLIEFLLENGNYSNVLAVDVSGSSLQTKYDLKVFLNSLETSRQFDLNSIVERFMFASLSYIESHFYNNLFVHFSSSINLLDLNDYILPNVSLTDRLYLLSYFSRSGITDLKLIFLKNFLRQNQNKNKKLKIFTDFECDSHKEDTKGGISCLDLKERTNILLNSTFTIIYPDERGFNWNKKMMMSFIEALKCSTIPVLIDSDLKIPLDHLISWDETIIRIPFSRIKYLFSILSNFDKEDLSKRRISARNIYNSYFSTFTNQFMTLFAIIQNLLALPPISIQSHNGIELKYKYLINKLSGADQENTILTNYSYDLEEKSPLKPSVYYDDNDGQDDEEENDFEFLGQLNQKPLSSNKFKNNFTSNNYLIWNKLFYPFNLFPATPFENQNIIGNEYIYPKTFTDDGIDIIQNVTLGGGDGKIFNHYLSGNFIEEQFTLVILTYQREKSLIEILEKYVKLPYLNAIIIVWNDLLSEPSNLFIRKFNLYLSAQRIRIIKSEKNSLNNRFLPYSIIKTDAILSLDDDVMLRADEIMLAFRVWRENRDRIVGFPARYHTFNFSTNNYEYKSDHTCEYSIILTGAAFYHRFFSYAYSYFIDERVKNKIDEMQNCEDIAFNIMVAHMTRKPPIKVTLRWNFYCQECQGWSNQTINQEYRLSSKTSHYLDRTKCLQYFISIYGYNPLLYSQYRADSVLFKTRLPLNKQKCFKLI